MSSNHQFQEGLIAKMNKNKSSAKPKTAI